MAIKVKKGSTFQFLIHDFTPEEWEFISTAEVIDVDISQGSLTHETELQIDREAKTILVVADTDNWKIGPAEFDLLVIRDGVKRHYPTDHNTKLTVIKSISTVGSVA